MYYRPFVPFNYGYRRYVPFNRCYGYYCNPYNNFVNSNYANVDQQIYNDGIMEDIIQQSIISQSPKSEELYTISADEPPAVNNIIPINPHGNEGLTP
jgi:hypothetical protein